MAQDQQSQMQGRVWEDLNADELRDENEQGIAGATVELVRDLDGDGTIIASEVLATTVTNAEGVYSFDNLTPGDGYQLRFATPGGYDATFSNQLSAPLTLQPGETGGNNDIGFFKFATLGDRVWNDANANGVQDAGEAGRSGVKVELYTAFRGSVGEGGTDLGPDSVVPGDLVATQFTDASGNYSFGDLIPGEYMVRFIAPDGALLSTANVGVDDAADSDADATSGFSGAYTLVSGEVTSSVDAGVVQNTTLTADSISVCEDRSKSFNVLTNDVGAGLKLIGVAHESSSLDKTFKSRGGAISFSSDGQVTYKSMTNYYGFDKLVYTVEDTQGNQFTQTVSVTVKAVSDAPVAYGGDTRVILPYSEAEATRSATGWRKAIEMSDFGSFSDSADKRQTFGNYNAGVANDIDSAKYVRLYGLTSGASYSDIYYKGRELSFGGSKDYYDIPVADIKAGRLELDFSKRYYTYRLKFAYVDSGTVSNGSCYEGSVVSKNDSLNLVTSPIALDLNGDGKIGVTGASSSSQKDASAELGRTVQFDIDADGKLDTVEWFDGSGDGILVDNRDGLAATQMNGARLFGDAGNAYSNGYDKLASLDLDGDGQLKGLELEGLVLWLDDGDAKVEDGELQTLAEHSIVSLSTQPSVVVDAQDRGHLQSSATRADGSVVLTEDVYFAHGLDVPDTDQLVSDGESFLDSLVGVGSVSTSSAAAGEAIDASDLAQASDLLRKIAAAIQGDALLS